MWLESVRTIRNDARAKECIGLQVEVPWPVWGGRFATSTNVSIATVWSYTKSVFILKLPAIAQTPDLRVSLAMLLGETPYDPSRESTYLTLRAHDGPFDFNPALFPPEQTVWDPRRACWIDVNAAICACLG